MPTQLSHDLKARKGTRKGNNKGTGMSRTARRMSTKSHLRNRRKGRANTR